MRSNPPPRIIAPIKPIKPKPEDFIGVGSQTSVDIYHDIIVIIDDFDLKQHFLDRNEYLPPSPEKRCSELSVCDIMNMAPLKANLADIFLRITFPSYREYVEVFFTYIDRDLDAEKKALQEALDRYQERYQTYQLELQVYEEYEVKYQVWADRNEIKQLEARLAELKGKTKRRKGKRPAQD
jgi:hypothetical protein